MAGLEVRFDYLVVGGGSSGCVVAGRLSEDSSRRVLLIEAGQDTPPNYEPDEVLDTYPGRAYLNREFSWSDLRVYFQPVPHNRSERPPLQPYEQGKILGGGSSINGMVAVRGAADDYDEWERSGAQGWGWREVMPFFVKLERDMDFDGPLHGQAGPVPIRRIFPDQWDGMTKATASAFEQAGYKYVPDMNGEFEEGYSPAPFNNAYGRRVTTAMAYLGSSVRQRRNLEIMTNTRVRRILFDNGRAQGVEIDRDGRPEEFEAGNVVLTAGAFHTPALLMHSGIGPAAHLQGIGIPVVKDLPGVGEGLQDHPCISVSAYVPKQARFDPRIGRHILTHLRYSSKHPDTPLLDMVLNVACRSAWHPLGAQLGTIQAFIGKSYSRGKVKLNSPDWNAEPEVQLNLLSDHRDYDRLADSVRFIDRLLRREPLRSTALDPFPSSYSGAARRVSERTATNRLATKLASFMMEGPDQVRRQFIRRAITQNATLEDLIADAGEMEEWVRNSVTAAWHPCGTCKMGSDDDPMAVLDSAGKVRGVDGIRVADASVMPVIPRANTNIPVIMVAEKLSAAIRDLPA